MEIKEIVRRLSLFGIPRGDSRVVREILARLVAADSISFGELQTARDIVGRSAGCENDAVYLFLAAMFISQRGGNAFLRAEKGATLLLQGGYVEDAQDGNAPNDEYAAMVQAEWDAAASAAEKLDGDIIAKRSSSDGDSWFFQRNLAAVEAVSGALAERAAKADGEEALSEAELDAAIGFEGFELNEKQVEAVRRVAQNRFVVVTGGPGTGKTTVVCAMLRALMARGIELDEIALAAPTGRAAQRMGEALRDQCARSRGLDMDMRKKIEALDGYTIHSLLGGFPPNWKYTEKNKLPLKLVVVDESSMVDLHLMKALIAALPDDCRLVLKTSSEFKQEIIQKRFSDRIKAALYDLFATDFEVLVLTDDDDFEPAGQRDGPNSLPEMAGYTFDHFIVGNSNRFAHAAAQAGCAVASATSWSSHCPMK